MESSLNLGASGYSADVRFKGLDGSVVQHPEVQQIEADAARQIGEKAKAIPQEMPTGREAYVFAERERQLEKTLAEIQARRAGERAIRAGYIQQIQGLKERSLQGALPERVPTFEEYKATQSKSEKQAESAVGTESTSRINLLKEYLHYIQGEHDRKPESSTINPAEATSGIKKPMSYAEFIKTRYPETPPIRPQTTPPNGGERAFGNEFQNSAQQTAASIKERLNTMRSRKHVPLFGKEKDLRDSSPSTILTERMIMLGKYFANREFVQTGEKATHQDVRTFILELERKDVTLTNGEILEILEDLGLQEKVLRDPKAWQNTYDTTRNYFYRPQQPNEWTKVDYMIKNGCISLEESLIANRRDSMGEETRKSVAKRYDNMFNQEIRLIDDIDRIVRDRFQPQAKNPARQTVFYSQPSTSGA